jgi:hypothetical protein
LQAIAGYFRLCPEGLLTFLLTNTDPDERRFPLSQSPIAKTVLDTLPTSLPQFFAFAAADVFRVPDIFVYKVQS